MSGFDLTAPPMPKEGHTLQWPALPDSQFSMALAQTARLCKAPLLLITNNSERMHCIAGDSCSRAHSPTHPLT
jgi:hypothetical protein